jgi:hypothetical protein
MTTARTYHAASLLSDGMVLVAGGSDDSISSQASAELYDPRTGTFHATGTMTTPRTEMAGGLPRDRISEQRGG